ncbi:hypothetical protein KKD52_13400 [Myxococcota bacterium]|nr:hypothetical protein [Myxococcota bacterium]MBU1410896.1 hypothetical protein [Myxococcota bacterium]MBU1511350.1 hypothetical protein [Myxococcota bacterium]
MLNARLVEKGKQFHVDAVLQQGNVTHGNVLGHLADLMRRGLDESRVTYLKQQLDLLAGYRGEVGVTRDGAKAMTADEGLARSEGKTLSRAVREALRIVLKDGPVAGISIDQFALHGNQLQTTPEVLAHLSALAPKLIPLDAHLARFFEGQKASELVKAAWERLRAADALQEKTRVDLPDETRALLELKGSVLDLIEEINGVARIAFEGQAEIRAKFNKDLLYRGRRARSKAAPSPTPVVPPEA